MFFRDIIGQDKAKQRLMHEAQEGKIPHARLFCGPEGTGKLPLAIAYARYLSCLNPGKDDACGTCPNCVKYNRLAHPDLHFVFPVIKKKGKDAVSDDFLAEWRELCSNQLYFNMDTWLKEMGAENQQALIYVKESDEITRKLSLKSSQGGKKIMIIWLPEKMNADCSNKLLKLLEEPAEQTVFLLVSEEPDKLLPTILSRTQRFFLLGIEDEKIAEELSKQFGIDEKEAISIAHRCEGSWLKALEAIHLNEDRELFFELFVSLMRLAYQRKIREMKQWSETLAAMGRERQKSFLHYTQRMLRENFIYNFRDPNLNRMDETEKNFATRFAPYINEGNVIDIMNEISEAQKHIEQNVNARMVFFDFSLKMIVLLIQK